MLNKLLKTRKFLNDNPKTSLRLLIQSTGLTQEEFDFLINNKIIERRGKTKGTRFYWVGRKPDYTMVQDFITNGDFIETQSMLDLVVNKYDISVKVNDNVTLRLINDRSASLRREGGEEVVFNDPVRLKDILSLIS